MDFVARVDRGALRAERGKVIVVAGGEGSARVDYARRVSDEAGGDGISEGRRVPAVQEVAVETVARLRGVSTVMGSERGWREGRTASPFANMNLPPSLEGLKLSTP